MAERTGVDGRAQALRRQAREHGLTLPTDGTSMLPNLRPGTPVEIVVDREPSFGDVVVFVSPQGSIVIHRWIGRFRGRHRCLGDNRVHFDPPFGDGRLVGLTDQDRVVGRFALHLGTVTVRRLVAKARRRIGSIR